MLHGRSSRKSIGVVAAIFTTVSVCLYLRFDLPNARGGASNFFHHDTTSLATLDCREISGANDTVVILKTGSTELQDKLPIHLQTTLRCYPHHLIFSDYAESYRGESIIDALEDVDPMIKEAHEDFALYRRLQSSGRNSLDSSELSGPASRPQDGTMGKPTNPGWRLDKWKFLPMIHRTLQEYPDKEWYVFVETDTYIFWSTLLSYLAALDFTKPYYIGGQSQIGDILFAHGGSGFAISRPALEAAVSLYTENKAEWESFTSGHWAGDCVLGKALHDSGTPLTWAWPIWQGDDIGNMDYGRVDYGKRVWCYPTVSYHHLSPSAVEDMWHFEQARISENAQNNHSLVIRHSDVFAEYILPRTSDPKSDWDNHAGDDRGVVSSLEDCRVICEDDGSCVQYALHENSHCLTTARPNLGEASVGVQSGWIQERMQRFHDEAGKCRDEGWIV